MKIRLTYLLLMLSFGLSLSCNKEKKLMERLVANWRIETSEIVYLNPDGTEEVYEKLNNAGKIIITQDPNDESKDSRLYSFEFIDANGDTLNANDKLVSDEKNKRLIMLNGYSDSTGQRNLVWTIDKNRNRRQVWVAFGSDSTILYPANNNNPGSAQNWVMWRITLRKN